MPRWSLSCSLLKHGRYSSFHQHITQRLLFRYVQFSKAALTPSSPWFLPCFCHTPSSLASKQCIQLLPAPTKPFLKAAALAAHCRVINWSTCGFRSHLQVAYQELVQHSSLLQRTNLFVPLLREWDKTCCKLRLATGHKLHRPVLEQWSCSVD